MKPPKDQHLCVRINHGMQYAMSQCASACSGNLAYVLLCCAIAAFVLGTWGWIRFLDVVNADPTYESFFKLLLPLVLWPAGVVALLISANIASAHRQQLQLVCCAAVAVACTLYTMLAWAQPNAFFSGDSLPALNAYVGQICVASGVIISTIIVVAVVRMWLARPTDPEASTDLKHPLVDGHKLVASPSPLATPKGRITLRTALFLVLYLPLCVVLTMLLPNSFNKWTWDSEGIKASTTCQQDTIICIDLGGSKAHLYSTVAVYYAFLYVISISALLTQCALPIRRAMHTALPVPSWLHVRCSLGALLLVAALLAMLGIETYLWHNHQFGTYPTPTSVEIWARVLGQLSGILLALLALPTARTSVWSQIFGVSWEAGIKTHIYLGYGFLAVSAAHMFCWWGRYAELNGTGMGSFPHDIFALPMQYHADNWTVQPVIFAWLLGVLCMGVFAHHRVRRACFELFYYSHHVYFLIYITALIHGTSVWYYLLGSLSLWALDRSVRFTRGCCPARITLMEPLSEGQVTHLEVQMDRSPHIQPGQYCFLNIPEISALQWHPFTVSDRVGKEGQLSFHIKAMGSRGGDEPPQTWTARLAELVQQQHSREIAISVDGPYGTPMQLEEYSSAIFVAGGIGITPANAMLRSMCSGAAQITRPVRLIWVVQRECEAAMLSESLQEMQLGGVSVSVFITKDTPTTHATSLLNDLPLQYRAGREIDLLHEFTSAGNEPGSGTSSIAGDTLVFACGPAALVERARQCSSELSFDFHSETFEL